MREKDSADLEAEELQIAIFKSHHESIFSKAVPHQQPIVRTASLQAQNMQLSQAQSQARAAVENPMWDVLRQSLNPTMPEVLPPCEP